MASINTVVAGNIKKLRIKHGLTQMEIADKLHMSQNAYSELESGKRNITLRRLEQIAVIYQVSIAHLLEKIPGKIGS